MKTPEVPLEIAEGVCWVGVIDWKPSIKELMDAPVFAPVSPTMYNSIILTVGGFLTDLRGLRPKGKKAVAFGSYGWGGGAINQMEVLLEKAKIELAEDSIQVKFKPFHGDLQKCHELGIRLAEIAKEESNTINSE